jgi:hypothetical protein
MIEDFGILSPLVDARGTAETFIPLFHFPPLVFPLGALGC